MQPVSPILPNVQLDTRSIKVQEILTNLLQAGLFRAIVVKQSGSQVTLDTSYGNLTGKAPQQLKTGDEIFARLTSLEPQPTLKIEKHIPRLLTLAKTPFKAVLQNQNSSLLAARVVSHSANHTLLKINNQNVQISRQASLQPGETLLLKETGKDQVQLIRIQPQAILKKALSALLPRNLQGNIKYNLGSLQKLSADLVEAKTVALVDRANIKTAELLSSGVKAAPITQTGQEIRPSVPLQSQPDIKPLKALLTSLAQPLARIENIRPQILQQIFTQLALIQSDSLDKPATLGQNLQSLFTELKQSPESFRQLIREIFQQQAHTHQSAQPDRPIVELSNSLRVELLQQTEQTLTHLLTQQTSARLQLDQNQPLLLNLNIPVQLDQENRELEISIRQRQQKENSETEQSWEIELSFEFGLLGMITTRVLLQDNEISANFWAKENTTKNLIDHHMDQFKSQLKKAGFEPRIFNCYNGLAPQPVTKNPYPVSDNLLDLEA